MERVDEIIKSLLADARGSGAKACYHAKRADMLDCFRARQYAMTAAHYASAALEIEGLRADRDRLAARVAELEGDIKRRDDLHANRMLCRECGAQLNWTLDLELQPTCYDCGGRTSAGG
jgi:antirestriction protein ArdC